MTEKIIYRNRKFLNKKGHHAGAYIIAKITREISTYRSKEGKDKPVIPSVSYDHILTIADCRRIINLDFECNTKKNYKNSIQKLDILIDVLNKFRNVMVTSYEEDEKLVKQGKLKTEKY